MFEAYKIGVSIGVIDLTRGGILKIAAQFAKAQTEASAFLETLRRVNEELARPSSWAGTAANDFRSARQEAEGYSRAARSARGAGVVGGSVIMAGAAYAGGAAAGRSLVPLAAGAAAYGNRGLFLPNQGAAPVPLLTGPAGGGGGSPPMRVAAGAMAGSGGGGALSPQAQNLFAAGGPWWRAGWGGGGGGAGGGGGGTGGSLGGVMGGLIIEHAGKAELGMLEGPIEEAARYQTAIAKFKLFGLTEKLNNDAISFAKSMNIIGTSMTDSMKFMTEAQGVFRESGLEGPQALAGAKLAAPVLARISYATRGLDDDTRAKVETQSLDMLRFVEMAGGLSSPKKFNELSEQGWKAIRSSGGNVNWSQLRQFMSTGSVAAQGLSAEALFGEMEPVIGELKGGGAGHGLMTAFQRLNGLQRLIPRIMQREMMRLDLWDPKKIQLNSQGGIKNFIGDPLKQNELYSSSPYQYYRDVVLPSYTKAGITKAEDVYRENAIIFGNTGGKLFSIMYRQMQNIEQSVEAQKKTLGIDASVDVVKATFEGQMLDYHAKMNNLQIQLGTVILPMLIKGLEWLNPRLQAAADWVGEHSVLTKGLLLVFAGLASLTMVAGAFVTLSSAFTLISGALSGGALGGLLMGVAGAITGPLGLVAALIALGGTVALVKSQMDNKGTIRDEEGKPPTWLMLMGRSMAFLGNKRAQDALDHINYGGDMSQKHWDKGVGQYVSNKWDPGYVSPYIALPKKQDIVLTVNSILDGRKVAESTTRYQDQQHGAPQTGISGFDSSLIQMPAGALGGGF